MKRCVTIRVSEDDCERMMDGCVKAYLKQHPEMKEVFLTRRFMFNQLVEFYFKTG